jgi:hypothetical protein
MDDGGRILALEGFKQSPFRGGLKVKRLDLRNERMTKTGLPRLPGTSAMVRRLFGSCHSAQNRN